MNALITPLARALGQLDDRAFLSVLIQSLALSALTFMGLHAVAVWVVHGLLQWHGPLAWLVDILGSIGASVLSLWLFLPLAAFIGTLFLDRIARAVEQRHYPFLPAAQGASLAVQIWDGLVLALRILLLNLLALLVILLLPGVGLILGWMVAAYGMGRGLFVAVAMRRMTRAAAEQVYRHGRIVILAQGGLLALASVVPLLNLFIPIIGTAIMVHVLDRTIEGMPRDSDAGMTMRA